ncbi:hypothetical protein B0T24DRAFT_223313 [Lasiosphaeria ovina]|uniref:Uncharacterized protein n=1 Tax=Lasiosphaeria ovina TaxID=92902 RepID=A0AAE0NAU7_9PEZI|nr:hypothetical protein B0T24DRAFT_223313 [Lasiosphaeria ovina]
MCISLLFKLCCSLFFGSSAGVNGGGGGGGSTAATDARLVHQTNMNLEQQTAEVRLNQQSIDMLGNSVGSNQRYTNWTSAV